MRAIAVILAFLAATAARAEPIIELERDVEMAMALSAAPDHLRAGAGVYRLGAAGYEQVRSSSNGFTCLVDRELSLGTSPLCFDREGTETTLAAHLMTGRLIREGRTFAEIETLVAAEYAAGRLIAPRRSGIVYMLSNDFSQARADGRRECIFPPHLMFYAPYLHNADIGAAPVHRGSTQHPWVLNEGKPNAYILVVGHGADTAACD